MSGKAHLVAVLARRGGRRLEHVLGGPARTYVIVLFACLLGLETADLSAVGAAASELRRSLHIDNAQLGLLAALPSLTAAVASLPIGMLTDRIRRVPMLVVAAIVWGGTMIACAASDSFDQLLLFRLGLGAATAVAGPTLASLTGDFFMPSERSRVYGFILTGELIGTGFGLLVSGELASVFGWRAAFWSLAPFAFALAYFALRLPEPARGGTSRLRPGAEEIPGTGESVLSGRPEADDHDARDGAGGDGEAHPAEAGAERASREAQASGPGDGEAQPGEASHDPAMTQAVKRQEVEPIAELVLEQDPATLSFPRAVRYVFEVKTNVAIIVASSLGYFFTAGIRTFGVMYIEVHYGVAEALSTIMLLIVSVGAIPGTIGGGRLSDWLIGRGHTKARVLVGGWGFIVAGALLIPGVVVSSLSIALPLLFFAGIALSAPNPAIDAARLDIIHSRMWGRAEGVRTFVRTSAVALAPLLFGEIADLIGGGEQVTSKSGYKASPVGLEITFVIMVIPMVIAGIVLLRARDRYPAEVASALAWEQRGQYGGDGGAPREDAGGASPRGSGGGVPARGGTGP